MTTKSTRYSVMFDELNQRSEIAWVPFIMIGYPTIRTSIDFIELLIESGADALELGIPFSDPVADGVLIQETARVALENGATVSKCLDALKQLRVKHPNIPFGLLTYANLVFHPGLDNFYANCYQAGVDSVLIADVPLIESKPFIVAADKNLIDAIFIAPPNASHSTLELLSNQNGAYTYVVSRPGVTGDNRAVEYPEAVVRRLLNNHAPAPILGFGISQPEHVKKAVSLGFKGVISGSAITRLILKNDSRLFDQLKDFSSQMKLATGC
ncbi:MAG: tryptophan synthase subunit alpha [Gammaproteobacteria bacterium]|nr:MAG: tryptophan synthase subunit alpha [Gammaproteobacteria bacterium]